MAETSSKNKPPLRRESDSEEEEERGVDDAKDGLELSLEKLKLGPRKKKLLIMGLSGFLCHRVYRYNTPKLPKHRLPDASYGSFYVYKRPYSEDFINFCFQMFEVGIWSAAREWYVDSALDCIMTGSLRDKLLFAWNQEDCTATSFYDLKKKDKPIFLKELKKVWGERPQFSSSNTLLIDCEPYKALLNPAHTSIFPIEYKADEDVKDEGLANGSELKMYLEKVADAEDVPGFIKQHPFGKPAICPLHPHWDFYSNIIRSYD